MLNTLMNVKLWRQKLSHPDFIILFSTNLPHRKKALPKFYGFQMRPLEAKAANCYLVQEEAGFIRFSLVTFVF